jgi:hypothetical protein
VTVTIRTATTPQATGRLHWRMLIAGWETRAALRRAKSIAKYYAICRPEVLQDLTVIKADGTQGRPTERRREFPWHPLNERPTAASARAHRSAEVTVGVLSRIKSRLFGGQS